MANKKIVTGVVAGIAAIALVGVGVGVGVSVSKPATTQTEKATHQGDKKSDTKSSESKKSESKKTAKSESSMSIPTTDDQPWFFKNDVFYAGMETYKLTGAEVVQGWGDKQVLAIKMDVINNSDKPQVPGNVFMVMDAKQTNGTSNLKLGTGLSDAYQQEQDNANNELLPGKTVSIVQLFELQNDSPVVVEFQDANFDVLGTKTYEVK